MTDIFLSYARVDADTAMRIKTALESLGLTVFIDTESFDAGDEFPARLEREIEMAGAVLGLWNAYSLSREWVKRECELALDLKKLLPVEIGPITDRVLTVEFSRLHRIDLASFDGSHDHKGWRDTVKSLAGKLGRPEILREDTRIKDAERRAEEERRIAREQFQRVVKQNEELKKRKLGLRLWHWAAAVVVTLGVTGAASGWVWREGKIEQKRMEAERREELIPEELRLQISKIDVNDLQIDERIRALLEEHDLHLNRLVQASALDADAAYLAGIAYYFGISMPQNDIEEAKRLLTQACDGQSAVACHFLGVLNYNDWYYESSELSDLQSAAEMFRRACNAGQQESCFRASMAERLLGPARRTLSDD